MPLLRDETMYEAITPAFVPPSIYCSKWVLTLCLGPLDTRNTNLCLRSEPFSLLGLIGCDGFEGRANLWGAVAHESLCQQWLWGVGALAWMVGGEIGAGALASDAGSL